MGFKKVLQSDHSIIIGSSSGDKIKFPPGFSYRVGGIIYTVKADVTQETNSPMREVVLSDGSTEIMLIETILKDLKEHDCEILEPDEKFVKKESIKKVVKKKVVKKKKAKKKAKKKED